MFISGSRPINLLRRDATAVALEVHVCTLSHMVKRGELPPPIRIAGRAIWFEADVLRAAESRRKPEHPAPAIKAGA